MTGTCGIWKHPPEEIRECLVLGADLSHEADADGDGDECSETFSVMCLDTLECDCRK